MKLTALSAAAILASTAMAFAQPHNGENGLKYHHRRSDDPNTHSHFDGTVTTICATVTVQASTSAEVALQTSSSFETNTVTSTMTSSAFDVTTNSLTATVTLFPPAPTGHSPTRSVSAATTPVNTMGPHVIPTAAAVRGRDTVGMGIVAAMMGAALI